MEKTTERERWFLTEMVTDMAEVTEMETDGLPTDETPYTARLFANITDGTDGWTDGSPTDENAVGNAVGMCPRCMAEMGRDGGAGGHRNRRMKMPPVIRRCRREGYGERPAEWRGCLATDLKREARAAGIGTGTLYRAAKRLGVMIGSQGNSKVNTWQL